MRELTFSKIANGTWKASIGKDYPTLLGLAGVDSVSGSDEEMVSFPFAEGGIKAEISGERHLVSIPFSEEEALYGLGLGYKKLDIKYQVYHLHCDHYSGRDDGRTHVPTAFYVSTKGYGIFIDTTEYLSFYMGGTVRKDAANPPEELDRGNGKYWTVTTPSEYVEVSFLGAGADVYVFAGKNMADVVARFNLLCGGGCMIPKWGLGFWNRIHIHAKDTDVYREAEMYREHGFPLDVIGLEPGWQSNSYPCTFEWSEERFPNPEKLATDLLEKGIRLNLWENMYVSRKSLIYQDIYPLSGSHMVWNGVVPDYTLPEACEIYAKHHRKHHLDIGISGFKIDECDGYDNWLWPDHATFPSGNSAVTLRQSYGMLAQKIIYGIYKERNIRTYGLVRASNAGASSFPFCIYNDCYSFKEFLNGISTAAFSGTLWVPEVRSASNAEEWVRRFQLCALSPMLMLNAWANGVKAWEYPEVEDIIREIVWFRKRIAPYMYNAFYIYHTKGIPPFRPICMDFDSLEREETVASLDHTENPYETKEILDITDQFMIGESLMAAPMEPGMEEREVVFPAGCKWYDFFTGEYAGSGEKKIVKCPLDKMLLFVREGGMIPILSENNRDAGEKLIIRCFGEKGKSLFYDDDGTTYDFEKGIYSLKELSFARQDGVVKGRIETVYDNYPDGYEMIFEG